QYLIVAPRQYKSSIPLARQSRYGNHANIATPDSHPDCRCFPIQIAALHAVQSQARLPDEMPSGEVITMGIMRPSDGKCGRVDRASDVCDGRCRALCLRSAARNESVRQTQKSEIFADRAERWRERPASPPRVGREVCPG